jgi:hypothetical protein
MYKDVKLNIETPVALSSIITHQQMHQYYLLFKIGFNPCVRCVHTPHASTQELMICCHTQHTTYSCFINYFTSDFG